MVLCMVSWNINHSFHDFLCSAFFAPPMEPGKLLFRKVLKTLKKAFDTVNHEIVLDKLNFYGIRGIPLTWLTSYLSHRQQCVMVHDNTSSYNSVVCRVPQGSVLYSFLLYINDLFHVSNLLSIILFADDTNIFLRHNDPAALATILNVELSHVSSWFNANKHTVHPAKSKFIIFHPRRKQINSLDINIFINNSLITRVQEDKFLGIIIHENLSWKPRISAVCCLLSAVCDLKSLK